MPSVASSELVTQPLLPTLIGDTSAKSVSEAVIASVQPPTADMVFNELRVTQELKRARVEQEAAISVISNTNEAAETSHVADKPVEKKTKLEKGLGVIRYYFSPKDPFFDQFSDGRRQFNIGTHRREFFCKYATFSSIYPFFQVNLAFFKFNLTPFCFISVTFAAFSDSIVWGVALSEGSHYGVAWNSVFTHTCKITNLIDAMTAAWALTEAGDTFEDMVISSGYTNLNRVSVVMPDDPHVKLCITPQYKTGAGEEFWKNSNGQALHFVDASCLAIFVNSLYTCMFGSVRSVPLETRLSVLNWLTAKLQPTFPPNDVQTTSTLCEILLDDLAAVLAGNKPATEKMLAQIYFGTPNGGTPESLAMTIKDPQFVSLMMGYVRLRQFRLKLLGTGNDVVEHGFYNPNTPVDDREDKTVVPFARI